jgi:diguanylate cyclase (GGDEF)-like protein/PAS domain S-box-containing protein
MVARPRSRQDGRVVARWDEQARLRRLLGLRVLGTSPESDFDEAVELATVLADVPVALIGLIDDSCQWYKAKIGIEHDRVPREVAICELVLEAHAPVVIEDLTLDGRTRDHVSVSEESGVRFYAGFPVVAEDGLIVGTLCLVDSRPRVLSDQQRSALTTLARQIMAMLDLRRMVLEREEQLAQAAELQQELAVALELKRAIMGTIPVGILACAADGRLTLINSSARELYGLPADGGLDAEAFSGRHRLLRADGVTALPEQEAPLVLALAGQDVEDVEVVIAPHGGPARLVRCAGRRLLRPDGAVAGAVVSMTDITAVRESEVRLQAAHAAAQRVTARLVDSERQFRDIFESGPLAIAQLDPVGQVVRCNPALRRLLGRTTRDISAHGLSAQVLDADRAAFSLAVTEVGAGTSRAPLEARFVLASGMTIWCEVTMSAGKDQDGRRTVLVQVADIDARKRNELELERQAAHDPLTGLPNRTAFQCELQARGRATKGFHLGLLFLDVDRFKAINDTYGHHVGDEVLVAIADRLRQLVRRDDLTARIGGDEFVVLLSDLGRGRESRRADLLAGRIRDAFAEPLPTSTGALTVRLSVGVAHAATLAELDDLAQRADSAMYRDKRVLPEG